jgi:hypothetical protein
MNDERIDALVDKALAAGSIPAGATPAERAEVETLLETMAVLGTARDAAEREAAASMPLAQARFQRHIAREQSAAALPQRTGRRARAARSLLRARGMAWVGSAAAVGAIVVAAVLLWRITLSEPTSAYAQVVEPGDYVQVEGVVLETSDGALSLKSALGDVDVELHDSTTVVDADTAQEVSTLEPGDRVLVSGIAGRGRKLVAQTLAVGGDSGEPAPRVITFKQLERLRPNLEGQVITYTISSDGTRGAVLIDAGDGERFLVHVDGASAAQLLARASTALGQRVRVVEESGITSGTFTLELPVLPPTDPTTIPGDQRPGAGTDRARPGLASVKGVVTNVEVRAATNSDRILEGLVTVQTLRGPVQVVVRLTTRILPGESGLTPGAGLRGEATGHTISVSGGIDTETGQVVADVIVMGPKLERPAGR